MEKIKLKNKFKNLDDLLLSYDKNTKIFSDLVVLKVGSFWAFQQLTFYSACITITTVKT